jgi:pyruvate ferredoxin oxidoreductase beta subunit
LAVESRYFPLVECDAGAWRITYRPKHPVPVRAFLETQGRFRHLSDDRIDAIQRHVDRRWDELSALATAPEGIALPALVGG